MNDEEKYWGVVADCLIDFHDFSHQQAHADVASHRAMCFDEIYHYEAFSVACDIANTELNIVDYVDKYLPILERNGW